MINYTEHCCYLFIYLLLKTKPKNSKNILLTVLIRTKSQSVIIDMIIVNPTFDRGEFHQPLYIGMSVRFGLVHSSCDFGYIVTLKDPKDNSFPLDLL